MDVLPINVFFFFGNNNMEETLAIGPNLEVQKLVGLSKVVAFGKRKKEILLSMEYL